MSKLILSACVIIAVLLLLIYFIVKRYRAARMERLSEHLAESAALEGRRA